MEFEQRKLALINWITNLEDENLLHQVESVRQASLGDLPNEIVELLHQSASESLEDCVEHTSAKELLRRK